MNTLRLVGKIGTRHDVSLPEVSRPAFSNFSTKYRISNSFSKIYIIDKLNFRAVQFDRAFPKACRVEVYKTYRLQ